MFLFSLKRVSFKALFCLAVVAGLSLFGARVLWAQSSDWEPYQRATRDNLLRTALYQHPERMVSRIAPSGAVGENALWEKQGGDWFIEQQRHCGDLIQAGLAQNDTELIEQGLRLMRWGFDHQASDGSFEGTRDPYHSTAMFVEGCARGLLLLRRDSHYKDVVEQMQPKVLRAAQWLTEARVSERGDKNNRPYTHRTWILAAALGETGLLSDNRELMRAADSYARQGVGKQRTDGTNPEKEGFDINYQAFGVLMATRYYSLCRNPSLQARIKQMIQHALEREERVITLSGQPLKFDSTRTGNERGHNGKIKDIDDKILVQAFVFGQYVTGKKRFQATARRLVENRGWMTAAQPQNPRHSENKPLQAARLDGTRVQLLANSPRLASVLIFLRPDCPLANRYASEINALWSDYSHQGADFFVVYATQDVGAARKHYRDFRVQAPALWDNQALLAKHFGAEISPEAVVVSPAGNVCYRGRIDDRSPRLGVMRHSPTRRDLQNALNDLAAGHSVRVARTQATGCFLVH